MAVVKKCDSPQEGVKVIIRVHQLMESCGSHRGDVRWVGEM